MAVAAGVLLGACGPAWGAAGDKDIYYGDVGQAIATLLTFAVLVYILGRYAWRPIVTQLRQREDEIAETVSRAETQQQEARELLEHYRTKMEQAETEAKEMLAASRREAADTRDEILAGAREQALLAVRSAKEDIRRAKEDVVHELRQTTAELAADTAAKVMGRALRPDDHDRLVAESLKEICTRVAKED